MMIMVYQREILKVSQLFAQKRTRISRAALEQASSELI